MKLIYTFIVNYLLNPLLSLISKLCLFTLYVSKDYGSFKKNQKNRWFSVDMSELM